MEYKQFSFIFSWIDKKNTILVTIHSVLLIWQYYFVYNSSYDRNIYTKRGNFGNIV